MKLSIILFVIFILLSSVIPHEKCCYIEERIFSHGKLIDILSHPNGYEQKFNSMSYTIYNSDRSFNKTIKIDSITVKLIR